MAGLARTRIRGATLGRAKVTAEFEERIFELTTQGVGQVKAVSIPRVGISMVQRVLCVALRLDQGVGPKRTRSSTSGH